MADLPVRPTLREVNARSESKRESDKLDRTHSLCRNSNANHCFSDSDLAFLCKLQVTADDSLLQRQWFTEEVSGTGDRTLGYLWSCLFANSDVVKHLPPTTISIWWRCHWSRLYSIKSALISLNFPVLGRIDNLSVLSEWPIWTLLMSTAAIVPLPKAILADNLLWQVLFSVFLKTEFVFLSTRCIKMGFVPVAEKIGPGTWRQFTLSLDRW